MEAGKVLQVLLWCYFVYQLGGFVSVIGPTLPDLQDHFQTNLTEISYLFLSLGVALSAGCLLSMVVLKFLDPNLSLAVCIFIGAAVTPLVALTPLLYVGCVAVVVAGVVFACAFNCVCHQCNVMFPGNPSILHGVFIATSVGGITSPLIATPFLKQRINNSSNESALSLEDDLIAEPYQNVLSIIRQSPLPPLSQNSTVGWMSTRLASSLLLNNYTNLTTSANDYVLSDESQVHLVYIIVGIAFLPAAVGSMVLYILQKKYKTWNPPQEVSSTYVDIDERGKKGKCIFVIFLSLLTVTYIPFAGVPYAYSSYLTTYGIESLRIDVKKMAEITSFFWLMYLLGRIISTFVSLYITQSTLMFVSLTGTLVSAILVTVIGPLNVTCLWVGSLPLGLFTAPLLAASLGWCQTCVPLTPLVLGVCTLGDMAGAAILPYITGQIIGFFGLYWFMYSIIIYAVFQLVSFGVLSLLGQMLKTA